MLTAIFNLKGLDVPDVDIDVQWKVPGDMNTMVQRFGRAARDVTRKGVAILIAEPQFFYEEQVRLEHERTKRRERAKRKAPRITDRPSSPAKRARVDQSENSETNSRTHQISQTTLGILSPSSRANRISRESIAPAERLGAPQFSVAVPTLMRTLPVGGQADDCNDELDDMAASESEEEEVTEVNADAEEERRREGSGVKVTEDEVIAMLEKAVNLKSKKGKSTSHQPRTLDPEMCLFINAHVLQSPRNCHRYHTNAYYANDKARKFSLCLTTAVHALIGLGLAKDSNFCCDRCAVKEPEICCDICHEARILELIPVRNDTAIAKTRKPRKIKVDKFAMSSQEQELRNALFKWREETAKATYAQYERYGGDILMHHSLIERVVELAHVRRLDTTDDLLNQTGWCFSSQYGAAVLELVHKYCPHAASTPQTPASVPFTTVPLSESREQERSTGSTKRVRAAPTCSVCNTKGHRSK